MDDQQKQQKLIEGMVQQVNQELNPLSGLPSELREQVKTQARQKSAMEKEVPLTTEQFQAMYEKWTAEGLQVERMEVEERTFVLRQVTADELNGIVKKSSQEALRKSKTKPFAYETMLEEELSNQLLGASLLWPAAEALLVNIGKMPAIIKRKLVDKVISWNGLANAGYSDYVDVQKIFEDYDQFDFEITEELIKGVTELHKASQFAKCSLHIVSSNDANFAAIIRMPLLTEIDDIRKSITDPVTGVGNRTEFSIKIVEALLLYPKLSLEELNKVPALVISMITDGLQLATTNIDLDVQPLATA